MTKIIKITLKDVPKEDGFTVPNFKNLLLKTGHTNSGRLESMAKGILEGGKIYDWHIHADSEELCIVLRGMGKFYWEAEMTNYTEGDIIIVPAKTMHKLEAESNVQSEFLFVRMKA